jgi:hypothetical protein
MKPIKLLIIFLFIASSLIAQGKVLGGDVYFEKDLWKRLTPTRIGVVGATDSLLSPYLITPFLGVAAGTSLNLGATGSQFKQIISSNKWTLQNDAASPANLVTIDSAGAAIIKDNLTVQGGILDITSTTNPRIRFNGAGTSDKGTFAVAASAGAFCTFAVENDMVFRATNLGENIILAVTNARGHIKFGTGATQTEKMRITNTGDVGIGAATAIDTQSPDLIITGDADSDETAVTTEAITLSLTSNATPTLATWGFTSIQGAGYTFDKAVTVNGAITSTSEIIGSAIGGYHKLAVGLTSLTKLNAFNFVNTDVNKNRTNAQTASDSASVNLSFTTSGIPMLKVAGKSGEGLFNVDSAGYHGLSPYSMLSDTTDQTLTGGTTADSIKFSCNDLLNGITHTAGNSKIYFTYAGKYLITFSALYRSSESAKQFNIWAKVNGTNLARSNTTFSLTQAQDLPIVVSFIVSVTAGQYFELYHWTNDAAGKLDFTTAQINPTRPISPSIILTINKVSD